MNRRQLLTSTAALVSVLGVSGCASSALSRQSAPKVLTALPKRFKAGDTVAVCAVSGVVSDTTLERAEQNLSLLGLTPKFMPNIRKAWGGYAGTIAERAADLHAAFADASVAGIWCARGGSGALGVLPALDYALIARSPKIVIGYSDVTALTNALFAKAGAVSFHGPVSSSTFSTYNVTNLQRVLFQGASNVAEFPENFGAVQRVDSNTHLQEAQGTLIGGNLSVFAAMVGTPYFPSTENALIFLEDVSEPPYRIDRMLTQLAHAGVFRRCAGVLLGAFTKTEPRDNDATLSLTQVLQHHFAGASFPVLANLPFGHIPTQWVLPVGHHARIDVQNGALTFPSPAVN